MNNADINYNNFIDCGGGNYLDFRQNAIAILNGKMFNTKINYNLASRSNTSTTRRFVGVQGTGVSFIGDQQFNRNVELNDIYSEYFYYKNLPYVNVKSAPYYAAGNGSTNDTAAIQSAINANTNVYIPTGNYLVDKLTLKENTNIVGDGTSKTILTKSSTITNDRDCLIYVDSNSSTSQINNITISNICLDGKVDTNGFREQTHLLWLAGVNNVNLYDIKFRGYRGDGLYFGGVGLSSNFTPRRNTNIDVVGCVFDGVNNKNRNGISVIDGTNINIDSCAFVNSTTGSMPGAIDFEPDHYYNVIENNSVRNCTFDNINSAIFAISTVQWTNVEGSQTAGIAAPYDVFPNGFTFENNTVTNSPSASMLFYTYQVSPPFNTALINNNEAICNITFRNNTCSNGFRPFFLTNANGVVFENNKFTDFRDVAYMSFPIRKYITCRNIEINNSTFERCGTGSVSQPGLPYFPETSPNGTAIRIYNIDTLTISGSKFIDCGNGATTSSAIEFYEGNYYYYTNEPDASYNININNNTFSTPTGKTNYAITTGSRWPQLGYKYNFNQSTNLLYENTNSLPYIFPANTTYKYNVKTQGGATGDGVTDDTTAISASISYAKTNNIPNIYFPSGTYMITKGFPLKDNMTVYGDGATSLLKMISGTGTITDEKTQITVFVGENAYGLYGDQSRSNTNNITIRDLAIDLQKPAGIYDQSQFSILGGIRFINPVNCTIDNVTILNPQSLGIGLYTSANGSACINNTVQNCTITMEPYWYNTGLGPNEVGPDDIRARPSSCIGIELSSNIGNNNNGTTIYLSRNNSDYIASKTQNNTIQNNTISGGSHGISVTNAKYNVVKGNSISGCGHRGILTAACSDYNTYEGNTVGQVGSTGIHFAYNCEHNVINNNTVNTVYGVEGDGIKSYVNCNYNTFTNNVVYNFYKSGIRVAHGANYNIITNNSITGNYPTSTVQKGVRILANTYAQYYNNSLTFNNQLEAHDNICKDNTISSVSLGVAVGDEMTGVVGSGKAHNNTVTSNTYTNVKTNENLNVRSIAY
jgi:parallel beta-helix repeat protein